MKTMKILLVLLSCWIIACTKEEHRPPVQKKQFENPLLLPGYNRDLNMPWKDVSARTKNDEC